MIDQQSTKSMHCKSHKQNCECVNYYTYCPYPYHDSRQALSVIVLGAFSRFSHKSIFQFYPEHVKPRPIASMAWVVPESVQVVLSIGVVLIILTLMWMIFAKLMGITSDQGRYRYISRYNNNNDG